MTPRPFKSIQQGAVLITVLVIVVALTLLIATSTLLLQKKLEVGTDSKQQVNEILAVYAKTNELKYLIATQRTTLAGLSTGKNKDGYQRLDGFWRSRLTYDEIRADGFEYNEDVNQVPITFSLQADNGLIPVNTGQLLWLDKLFSSQNIPSITISKLKDRLLDYIDNDDWSRPAGAEVFEYERANMPAPLNYLLPNCGTLANIDTWQNYLEKHEIILNYCKVSRAPTLNFNAIPEALLSSLSPNRVGQVIASRNSGQWYMNHSDVIANVPEVSNIPEPYFTFIEDTYFRFHVSADHYQETWYIIRGSGESPPVKSFKN